MHLSPPNFATITAAGFVGALALIGAFTHLNTGPLPKSGVIKGEFQSAYEENFKAANPLIDIAVGAFASIRFGLLNEASTGAIVGQNGWLFTTEELEVHQNFDANIHDSAERIAQVRDELATQGVRLVTAIVPDKAEIYEDQLGMRRSTAVSSRLRKFLGYLDLAGVDRVDAAKVMRNTKTQGDVFMHDDTHWSPLGAKTVADAIGRRLSSANIDRTNVQMASLGAVEFDGDLLSFIPTGPFRATIGPHQQTIAQFETSIEVASGLFGDATVDVVLVGTSFSAKSDWHFEGFLKRALRADVLNLSSEGQGPFAPMDAFLAGDILKTTPPKIVIWEIPVRYISKDLN